MKVVITAGGGGHFSPALAVMKRLESQADLMFIGRKYAFEEDKTLSFEYHTMKDLEIPFATITTGKLQRRFSWQAIVSLSKVPVGLFQAYTILIRERPDVVLSFGGYIALPVTIAAFLLGIPVVIHEQTMRSGIANRIAGKFAARICLTFPSSKRYFPRHKTVLTGNPLRESFLHPRQHTYFSERLPLILVTGGSLGAHAINQLIEGIVEKLLEKYLLIHQTGDAQEYHDYERLEEKRHVLPPELRERYKVMKFIDPDEMAAIMQQASLIISRAGASTLQEIIYFEKPVLLIPLPHGQRNEQLENAEYAQSLGIARVKHQKDLTSETLYTEIERMMDELSSYRITPDHPVLDYHATEKIITVIFSLTQKLRTASEETT